MSKRHPITVIPPVASLPETESHPSGADVGFGAARPDAGGAGVAGLIQGGFARRTGGACGLASCDDRAMGPAEGSGAVAGRVARPGTGGVVSRPGLFERLGASARVTVVSAPPGSGKTVLLRSWIGEAGLGENAAWVSVGPGETDPQRFWLSVLGALRRTSAGSGLVQAVTAAPDLDGWAIVGRLLKDLAPLARP